MVSIAPGTTQLAVMWSAARSCASAREKPTRAGFRRHHMGAAFRADMRAHAADIDDGAAVFFHRRQAGVHAVKRRVERGVHHLAPFGIAHLVDRLFAPQRSVVDQDIDAAEGFQRGLRHRLDRGGIGDVGEHGDGLAAGRLDLSDHGVGFLLVGARVHHHRRAGGGKLLRDGAADIAPGAGDDGDFAGEFFPFSHLFTPVTTQDRSCHHTACPAA